MEARCGSSCAGPRHTRTHVRLGSCVSFTGQTCQLRHSTWTLLWATGAWRFASSSWICAARTKMVRLPRASRQCLREALRSVVPSGLEQDLPIPAATREWPQKELKRCQKRLQQKVALALDEGSAGMALPLLRGAFLDGWPTRALEPALQRLLTGMDPQEKDGGLQLCLQILSHSEESLGEASLSSLVALLVDTGRPDAAEAVLQHAVSIGQVKMRTFQPLLEFLAASGAGERLRWIFHHLLQPLVSQRQIRLNGASLATLLRGFGAHPEMQEEVLALLSLAELELPRACLERISREELPGLHMDFVLRPPCNLGQLLPDAGHAEEARGRAAALLKPETLRRLAAAMQDAGNGPATCFVDGPNVGYRGAVQRRQESEGGRKGAGGKNFSREEDMEISNLHAEYFRHDQIEAAMGQLREQGEVPLLIMPARYVFAPPGRRAAAASATVSGPMQPQNRLVESWLVGKSLFVVSDDEPDDVAWIFGTLGAQEEDQSLYVVTRDKAANHRGSIWGVRFGSGQRRDLELERSFRRWSALRLRWYAVAWDGCDHDQGATVRIDGLPPLSMEIQQQNGIWYIPEATGSRWLAIARKKSRAIASLGSPGDAALVAGDTDADCCVKTCTGFVCGQTGFVLRADADTTTGGVGGNSDATCCVKSCSLYECPRGRNLVANAATIIADSENSCCE
ncbi:unnamed protein product [Symbiodinium natans]|uniref:Uncharacterized protein n=1 Tax=Symbiodinium natans TaxID=878477 RepID=A0A812L6Y5_9DINO|nr:unnamed protein product [Symbiodinium natans]